MNETLNPANPADIYQDQMLVKLALAYKLLTNKQYMQAMDIQKQETSGNETGLLSDILRRQGFLNTEQFRLLNQAKDMLTHKRKEKRFGAIALSKGYLTEPQLNEGLVINKNEKKEIGRVLLELGYLTPEQHQEILDIQKDTLIDIPSFEDVCRASGEKALTSQAVQGSMMLNVSQDALTAVLVLPEAIKSIDTKTIHEFLESKNICFGIISDDTIKTYLQHRDLGLNAFIVAQGQNSIPPDTGPTVFHFDPAPLIVDIDDTKRMSVKEGDLLAEREILREGLPRATVYGVGFEGKEPDDHMFIKGNGTRMNENRSMITAAMDGEPFYHPDGAICVIQDIDMEEVHADSGPISIDGHIRIKGPVTENTSIRGTHIQALRVEGATIRTDGNLRVTEDLVGTTVVAAGTVRARSIKNCKISSMGDVLSETDILESRINTQGRCLADNSIENSHIRATRGIRAKNIMSSEDSPTQLEFGTFFVSEFIAESIRKAEELEKNLNDTLGQIQSRESMIQITRQIIQDIGRDLIKNEKEHDILTKSVARMEQKSQRTIATGRTRIMELDQEIKAARETASVLTEDNRHAKESLLSLKKGLQIKMKEFKEIKGKISQKIFVMKGRLDGHPDIGGIHVSALVQKGTHIKGPHCNRILQEDRDSILIREIPLPEESQDGLTHYSIEFEPSDGD